MDAGDRAAVEAAWKNGVGVLHNLLSQDELDTIRRELEQAYLDMDMGPGDPGSRDSLRNEPLLNYPALGSLFSHPRILGIVSAILDEPRPFLLQMKTNRYTPKHKGVGRHSDGSPTELAAPFQWLATMIYLDDIDVNSGALTYVPGTHLYHSSFAYQLARRSARPSVAAIYHWAVRSGPRTTHKRRYSGGSLHPNRLESGQRRCVFFGELSVILSVSCPDAPPGHRICRHLSKNISRLQVWHGVVPIHRLRRYITGLYTSRKKGNTPIKERIQGVRQSRKQIPGPHGSWTALQSDR